MSLISRNKIPNIPRFQMKTKKVKFQNSLNIDAECVVKN